jgi:hypothetical protein
VDIRPDLVDLDWARGAEPTPHGLLNVDVKKGGPIVVDVPDGVKARLLVPVSSAGTELLVNGSAAEAEPAENGGRMQIMLDRAGHYELTTR